LCSTRRKAIELLNVLEKRKVALLVISITGSGWNVLFTKPVGIVDLGDIPSTTITKECHNAVPRAQLTCH